MSDEPVPPLDEPEEGLISESEEPDLDTDHDKEVDMDKTVTEDQSCQETVKTVRAYTGWNYIPDLEYTVSSCSDNPWTGNRSQPVGKISVAMPPEDWLCRKLESLNLIVCAGYHIRGTESGGLHSDQFIRPPVPRSLRAVGMAFIPVLTRLLLLDRADMCLTGRMTRLPSTACMPVLPRLLVLLLLLPVGL